MSPVQGLPEDNTGYGTREYWCVPPWRRFILDTDLALGKNATKGTPHHHSLSILTPPHSEGQDSSFDWFLQPEYLVPLLEPYLLECGKGKDVRVLMLGCGNSLLGEVVRRLV